MTLRCEAGLVCMERQGVTVVKVASCAQQVPICENGLGESYLNPFSATGAHAIFWGHIMRAVMLGVGTTGRVRRCCQGEVPVLVVSGEAPQEKGRPVPCSTSTCNIMSVSSGMHGLLQSVCVGHNN